MRPAAYNAKARLQDMDQDGIDLAVLYPTMLLGLQSVRDVDFAEAQARAYNDWCSDHMQEGEGRLFGAGAVPPMHEPTTSQRVAAEIRRVAELPGMVSVFMRPNPSVDWRPFNDPVYDPIWQAAADTGLPDRAPPVPRRPTCPARASGCGWRGPVRADGRYVDNFDPDDRAARTAARPVTGAPNMLFTQAIANPVDVMSWIAYLTAGGVCERFPDAKFIFLEANGGWLVPWLERLDHHCQEVPVGGRGPVDAAVGVLPPPVLDQLRPRRVDAAFTANSPLVGADRIIWASDYPHPDAKFPGVTEELAEALEGLDVRAAAGRSPARARSRSTASGSTYGRTPFAASEVARSGTSGRTGAVVVARVDRTAACGRSSRVVG